MTKFGIDQTGSPPPLWWRRLERALIIAVAPAVAALLISLIEDEKTEAKAVSIVTFFTAIIKSVGMFLGTDVSYPDEKEQGNEV
jgi:hypothetical protein